MDYKPHDYQKIATDAIIQNNKQALFLDCGLGKTISTLTAIQELIYLEFEIDKVLVIAPKRVAETTWSDEIEKWDHLNLNYAKILGNEKQRVESLNLKADVYLINRENVLWLVDYFQKLKKWPFDMIVIDELSSFKASNTKRFRALRKVTKMTNRIVGLTATPAPNSLMELWPEMYLLDEGARLGRTLTNYRSSFFTPGKHKGHIVYEWKLRPGAEKKIYDNLRGLVVSMKAEDWLEMPELVNNYVYIKLEKSELEKYNELEKEKCLAIGENEMIVGASAGVVVNKLLQFANGSVYKEDKSYINFHDKKLEALEELIESANGNPVMVIYQYRFDLERIRQRFKEAIKFENEEHIRLWNEGKIKILLLHPASAGHGLNLQYGGNQIIWYSQTWSLELYQQTTARLYRQGQKRNVICHHLIAKDTIDEEVVRALDRKSNTQDNLREALKARREKYLKY